MPLQKLVCKALYRLRISMFKGLNVGMKNSRSSGILGRSGEVEQRHADTGMDTHTHTLKTRRNYE